MSDKLNLYSDIGNIIALKQRAKRNINLKVIEINETEGVTLENAIFSFIGGGSDREQSIATKELSKIKTILKDRRWNARFNHLWWISILGTKYITPDGTELEGLGILDFYTKSKQIV